MPVGPHGRLLTRAWREYLRGLWVAGREVVAEGRLTGLDAYVAEEDLRTARRIAMPATANFRAD